MRTCVGCLCLGGQGSKVKVKVPPVRLSGSRRTTLTWEVAGMRHFETVRHEAPYPGLAVAICYDPRSVERRLCRRGVEAK